MKHFTRRHFIHGRLSHRYLQVRKSGRAATSGKSSATYVTSQQFSIAGRQERQRLLSRTAVIYKQQGWKDDFLDEKVTKCGRRRPCRLYLDQLKQSRVDDTSSHPISVATELDGEEGVER